jgi:archaellum component FlaC
MERVDKICNDFVCREKALQKRLDSLERHGIEKLPKKQMKEILTYLETINNNVNILLDQFASIIGCYVDAVNQLNERVAKLESK